MSTEVFTFTVSQPYAEGEEHSTQSSDMEGGRGVRRARWSRGRFIVSQAVIRCNTGGNSLASVQDFFADRQGRYDTFLYKPRFQVYATVTAEAVGSGTGSVTAFALDSKYIDSTTLKVYKDAVLQSSGYSLGGNYTAPVITFTPAPANGVVITATYDRYDPCTFDTDRLQFRIVAQGSADTNAVVEVVGLAWSQDYPGSHLV